MCDFTAVNPTKDSFPVGTNVNAPFVIGLLVPLNPTVGQGTLVTYTSNTIVLNGNYSYLGQSGSFDISVVPSGSNFVVTIQITGSCSSFSRTFTASCSMPQPNTVQLTDINDPTTSVTFSQNNGSWLTDGKIDIDASWCPVNLYIDANV